jgi:outer membrane protein assembly factor BamD
MKKLWIILVLVSFVSCAKEPPFNPTATFSKAEEKMQSGEFEDARKEYQSIQEKSPDKAYDPVLMLRVADTYFGEKKYSEAQVEYQAFLNYHPVHKDAAYAQYQVAMCSYKELTSIDRDPVPNKMVIREMRKLREKYPRSSYSEEATTYIETCTDRLAQYEFYVAHFYYKKDAYKATAGRCEYLLKTYPGSSVEKDALYYAGLSYMELGEQNDARIKFEELAQKFPDMKKTAEKHLHQLTLKQKTP